MVFEPYVRFQILVVRVTYTVCFLVYSCKYLIVNKVFPRLGF